MNAGCDLRLPRQVVFRSRIREEESGRRDLHNNKSLYYTS